MTYVVKEFEKYVMYYIGGKELLNKVMCAEIDFFKGNTRVGELFFIKEGEPLPSNYYSSKADVIFLYFEISQFNDVATILREEKPLYISYETATKMGYISTVYEPIGEQE